MEIALHWQVMDIALQGLSPNYVQASWQVMEIAR